MPPFFSCISQLRCNFNRDKQKELDFEKSNSFCSNSHSCSKSVPLLLCRTPLSCECLFYFLVYGSFSLPSSISRVFLFSFLFFAVFRSVIDLIGKQGNSKCKHGCDDKQRHRTFIDVNVSQVNRYISCDVENNGNYCPLFFSG